MKIFTVILFLVVMVATDARAQEKACTQMGCTNGLLLRPGAEMFDQPGRYEFQFFTGTPPRQGVVTCKGSLPLKPCEEGPSFTCNSKDVVIGEVGCAMPRNEHKIGDIYLYGTPRKVVFVAKHNGQPYLARTLRPSYIFTRPNGPGCEPQCVMSTVELSATGGKD